MENTEFSLPIYSPRWGHDDNYTFVLTSKIMTIKQGASSTICTYKEGKDPEWSGQPLNDIFRNDYIHAPAVFQDMLEHAWNSWRKGDLCDDEVKTELESATQWLNEITKSKPSTEFWKLYF